MGTPRAQLALTSPWDVFALCALPLGQLIHSTMVSFSQQVNFSAYSVPTGYTGGRKKGIAKCFSEPSVSSSVKRALLIGTAGNVVALLTPQHPTGMWDYYRLTPFCNGATMLRLTQAHMQMQGLSCCRSYVFVYKLGHVSPVSLHGESPEGIRQETSLAGRP